MIQMLSGFLSGLQFLTLFIGIASIQRWTRSDDQGLPTGVLQPQSHHTWTQPPSLTKDTWKR